MKFTIYNILIIVILLFVLIYFKKYNIENFKNNLGSVVIVGCARDIGRHLHVSLKKIDMLIKLFNKSNVIIFENDSRDNTLSILKKWKNNRNNIEIISETKDNNPLLKKERTVRLAYGRNLLLDKARNLNPEYFICMDLDNVVKDLTKDNFLKIFDLKENWSMIGSNNKGLYRDYWALRCENWLDGDFHSGEDILKQKKVNNIYIRHIHSSK